MTDSQSRNDLGGDWQFNRVDCHFQQLSNSLQGSYPLTPATPLSNIASDVFYGREEETAMTEEQVAVGQPQQQEEEEGEGQHNGH